jgi:hypothetical protein
MEPILRRASALRHDLVQFRDALSACRQQLIDAGADHGALDASASSMLRRLGCESELTSRLDGEGVDLGLPTAISGANPGPPDPGRLGWLGIAKREGPKGD